MIADFRVPLPTGVVVRVVRRRHLHAAGAEFGIGELAVGDDGNLPARVRLQHQLADELTCSARRSDARTRRYRRASFQGRVVLKAMNVSGSSFHADT